MPPSQPSGSPHKPEPLTRLKEVEEAAATAVEAQHGQSPAHRLFVEEDRIMREICACSEQIYELERAAKENMDMAKGTLRNHQNQLKNVRSQIQQLIQQEEEAKNKIARKMERESRRR